MKRSTSTDRRLNSRKGRREEKIERRDRGEEQRKGKKDHRGRNLRGHIPSEPGPLPRALIRGRVREFGHPLGLHPRTNHQRNTQSIRG
ncbi:hypothetical protein BHE74_00002702 [Ensete ventricosum]|nr:hypothetical protein GW17_00039986 [Ensete ventricosum]RWW88429.1 hypothetical protein BHE74_00002702 [Ensete ventricosum]